MRHHVEFWQIGSQMCLLEYVATIFAHLIIGCVIQHLILGKLHYNLKAMM